jgi:hypothetical protein
MLFADLNIKIWDAFLDEFAVALCRFGYRVVHKLSSRVIFCVGLFNVEHILCVGLVRVEPV